MFGHDDSKCWKLHPELMPKNFLKKKGEMKNSVAVQQELGSYPGHEMKITSMVLRGNPFEASFISTCSASSSKYNNLVEGNNRVEFFSRKDNIQAH